MSIVIQGISKKFGTFEALHLRALMGDLATALPSLLPGIQAALPPAKERESLNHVSNFNTLRRWRKACRWAEA